MNEALMRIVVGVAMFFEGSKDDVIDPDVALKQLEWIHWELAVSTLARERRWLRLSTRRRKRQTTIHATGRSYWSSGRQWACATRSSRVR
jgi:hypothetical protein